MTPDKNDQATEQEALRLAAALAHREPEGPPPAGECLSCGAPLKDGRRWCDADCRDDWQREQDAIRRNGGVRSW
ncbi:MAG: hypothetical protein AB1330_13130 [Bacillota bacterium]